MADNLTIKDGLGTTQTVKTTDNTGVHTPHVDVDTLPALPAGSNVIGGVTIADGSLATLGAEADAAAGGDTSSASLMSLFKRLLQRVTTLIGQLPSALTGSGNLKVAIEESAATVTVAGEVSVDDGGGSLTVDGTVAISGTVSVDSELTTADLDTGAGTDTRAVVGLVSAESGGGVLVGSAHPLPANLAQIAGTAADVNSGNKSNGTLRVVVATDQPALTSALKVDGSAVTQPVSMAGTVTVDTELPAAAALADGASNPTTPMDGACLLVFNGASWDRLRAATKRVDLNAVSVTSIATLLTPTSGKKFRLMGGCLSLSAAGSLLLEDNGSGNFIFRTPKLAADTPYNFDIGQGYLSSAANNVLKGTASASATVTGTLYYAEE